MVLRADHDAVTYRCYYCYYYLLYQLGTGRCTQKAEPVSDPVSYYTREHEQGYVKRRSLPRREFVGTTVLPFVLPIFGKIDNNTVPEEASDNFLFPFTL